MRHQGGGLSLGRGISSSRWRPRLPSWFAPASILRLPLVDCRQGLLNAASTEKGSHVTCSLLCMEKSLNAINWSCKKLMHLVLNNSVSCHGTYLHWRFILNSFCYLLPRSRAICMINLPLYFHLCFVYVTYNNLKVTICFQGSPMHQSKSNTIKCDCWVCRFFVLVSSTQQLRRRECHITSAGSAANPAIGSSWACFWAIFLRKTFLPEYFSAEYFLEKYLSCVSYNCCWLCC